MAQCYHCKAEIKGQINYWHQNIAPTDNPNNREDISAFPISCGSVMVAFCSASCLSEYIKQYSGETISQAKLNGTPNQTGIINILKEPYSHNDKTKQELDKEGFKRLKNDGNKGDLRSQVGLSDQEKSQQIIYKKLNNLKSQQNMETQAKTIIQCDNCRKAIDMKAEKGEAFKAILNDRSTQKSKDHHFCSEECLRQHLNSRAKKKKSKASLDDIIELDITDK